MTPFALLAQLIKRVLGVYHWKYLTFNCWSTLDFDIKVFLVNVNFSSNTHLHDILRPHLDIFDVCAKVEMNLNFNTTGIRTQVRDLPLFEGPHCRMKLTKKNKGLAFSVILTQDVRFYWHIHNHCNTTFTTTPPFTPLTEVLRKK